MPAIVMTLPEGTAGPTGMAQFGNKFFLCFEDQRPIYLMAGMTDSRLKAYRAGIKAPMTGPTVADSETPTEELTPGVELTVAYAFFSSKRLVMSRLSPATTHVVADPAMKLTIGGFEAPRDDAISQDIDTIMVAVQMGISGQRCVTPGMRITVSGYDFGTASLTFDTSENDLTFGIDMAEADLYGFLPPAARYVEMFGERVWYGGQRRTVELGGTGLTVTKGQSFRGQTLAKLTLNGDGVWDDAHLYLTVWAEGRRMGTIYDVENARVTWLDVDLETDLGETTNWHMTGSNDRIWPSSFHNFTEGSVPTSYPECVNMTQYQTLKPALDRGEQIKGIHRMKDILPVIFQNLVMPMTGSLEVGVPQPIFSIDWGRVGATAPGSICEDAEGNLWWIGEEGFISGNTAGIDSIAHQLGVNRLFKGAPWIALTDLPGMVMSYSRQHDGLIFGNFSINGVNNYWGLLSLKPQLGVWLFSGQEMTSNILEYGDANGQGRLLVGDGYHGRVKRILSPDTLLDLPAASDTAAAFTWQWREGWQQANEEGFRAALAFIRVIGLIMPGTTVSLNAVFWRNDYPARVAADVPAGQKATKTFTQAQLLRKLPAAQGAARYHSVAISGASNTGASGTRGVEFVHWQSVMEGES